MSGTNWESFYEGLVHDYDGNSEYADYARSLVKEHGEDCCPTAVLGAVIHHFEGEELEQARQANHRPFANVSGHTIELV